MMLQMCISGDKEKRFVASFRDESHKWFLTIHEMWSGKLLSDELHDPSILQIAKQNVLIVDAFLQRSVYLSNRFVIL